MTGRVAGALLAGVVTLALYASTLCPTVPAGDSGELITVCHTLGVAHPPGYPLFTLLGAAADRVLPFGEPATRVNALGAFVAACGAALVFALARRASGRAWPAAAGAAVSALSVVTWRHASGAEVFGLNVALNVGAVLAVLALDDALSARRSAGRRAALVGLLFGLGMSNHHTTALVAASCLVAFVVRLATRRYALGDALRAVGAATLGGLAGLLPYLYLPWAAARGTGLVWGDPTSLQGFVHHLLRRDYGTFDLMSTEVGAAQPSPLEAPAFLLRRLGPETAWIAPLVLVTVVGLALARRLRPRVDDVGDRFAVVLCAALAVVTGPLFFALFNAPLEQPLMHGVVIRFAVLPLAFTGVVVAWCLARLPLAARVRDVVCAGLVVFLAVAHHGEVDMSETTFTLDLGRDVLASVPEGALFSSRGDLVTNAVEYQQFCLGARPDVLVVDQEKLTYPWYAAAIARRDPRFRLPWPDGADDPPRYDGEHVTSEALVAAHIDAMPVAIVNPKDPTWQRSFEQVRRGLVWTLHRPGEVPSPPAQAAVDAELLDVFARPSRDEHPDDGFEQEACRQYAQAFFAMGYTAEQLGDLDRAAALYERATALDPWDWRPWLNLGVVRQRAGDEAAAADAWEACLATWRRRPPWHPEDDPGPPVDDLQAAIDLARRRTTPAH